MSNRERRGSYDYWGCVADYDHECADEARKQRHECGECQGAPVCAYCLTEQERGEESSGG
jgi:hypothetical protein